jgi:hypothetical protein
MKAKTHKIFVHDKERKIGEMVLKEEGYFIHWPHVLPDSHAPNILGAFFYTLEKDFGAEAGVKPPEISLFIPTENCTAIEMSTLIDRQKFGQYLKGKTHSILVRSPYATLVYTPETRQKKRNPYERTIGIASALNLSGHLPYLMHQTHHYVTQESIPALIKRLNAQMRRYDRK